jgi:hypothetical protein
VQEFSFKTGLYKYYAPWLYRICRLKARIYLLLWNEDKAHLDTLAQLFWDKYLAAKFEQELLLRGHQIEDKLVVEQNNELGAFILGSGASINDVSTEQWQDIKGQFSLGLNNFYIHSFTPNVYFCEFVDNPEFLELIYRELLDNPARKDAKVMLAGRYILFRGGGYRKPTVQTPTLYITRSVKIRSKSILKQLLNAYYSPRSGCLTHHISNLDTAIHYCVQKGFKNIYLMGVDLTDDGYFWDQGNSSVYAQARHFIRSFHNQVEYQKDDAGRHATASNRVAERLGNFTILEYIDLLQKDILKPLGVQLWVCNPRSLLASILPVYNMEKENAPD